MNKMEVWAVFYARKYSHNSTEAYINGTLVELKRFKSDIQAEAFIKSLKLYGFNPEASPFVVFKSLVIA